jgi:rRNA biogenesis protein RRP5
MAPIKRKNDPSTTSAGPISKKQKAAPQVEHKTTALRDEEPSFARGGASILTPLEHKQIQIKAQQDVLFEQQTGRKPVPQFDSDDEDNGDQIVQDEAGGSTITPESAQKRRNKSKKIKSSKPKEADQGVKIEGLSHRRIAPGSLVLGLVSKVSKYDVTLALPNNLTGRVPLTAISKAMTERIEKLAAEDDSEEGDDETAEASGDIDLNSILRTGQYLRACVTSTGGSADTSKERKHIELSIRPDQTNPGIIADDIPRNAVLQAEVKSVEDHGLVMDLGLGSDVKGFIGKKDIGSSSDMKSMKKGAVLLCLVLEPRSKGQIVKLSADPERIGNIQKGNVLADSPTIDNFIPGAAVDVLITDVSTTGIAGKVLGVLDVTADAIHSGFATSAKALEKLYPIGSKAKARVVCTFPNSEKQKIGVSFLDHVLSMVTKTTAGRTGKVSPTEVAPLSKIVAEAKVAKVDPTRGLFLDLGVKGVRGFAHISRVSDKKVDTLMADSGPYKIGSTHQCRVVGYNPIDGLFLVSMEQKIIDLPYLMLEDIIVGETLKGTVEKLVTRDTHVKGLLVKITDNISGFVPEMHLSDVRLLHPERKFQEGASITARVLSIDHDKRRLQLTLKKTLVNSDASPWTSYANLSSGMQSPGTLVNVMPNGAVVQFYGNIRGFLPVSQMSESYIGDATQHFRNGQVVNVRIVSVAPSENRMIVSCRQPEAFGPEQETALKDLAAGSRVRGTVSEKSNEDIVVELSDSALKATLSNRHLVDGSEKKCFSAAKKIRVGQTLQDIVVLSVDHTTHAIRLTSRPSLIKAFELGSIPGSFEEVMVGSSVIGFVKNITLTGVFVQFANGLIGLLPKNQLGEDASSLPDFGLQQQQTLDSNVLAIDMDQRRFLLTQKPPVQASQDTAKHAQGQKTNKASSKKNDAVSSSIGSYTIGKVAEAKVISVKDTQLNVELAEGVHGRIDVSQVFGSWDEIKDRKHPLQQYSARQTLPVRVLGFHDHKTRRFLPITHVGKASVVELSAKKQDITSENLDILTMEKVKKDSSWLCFVNNVAADGVWVNLSPNVRGRITAMDLTDDFSLLSSIEKNFPVGSAIRARVTHVDPASNKLDLSARSSNKSNTLTIESLSEGMVLPGKVTKVSERSIMVQLSDSLSAPVHLVNLVDDFSTADPTSYQKNQIIRVCVLRIDLPNKKVVLSTRPSRVLSSSLPVVDPEVMDVSSLKVNDVIRGFVRHVADNGVFVNIGSDLDAFVRVANLSDAYLKEWKSEFEIDRLIQGKVISVDARLNNVQLSLKESVVQGDYKPPLSYTDLKLGQVVTGKVRKVEGFGVFVVIDNSNNVSGLCHRSEMADEHVADAHKLYEEGDMVKAKILKIDLDQRRVSLGLKASYFRDVEDASMDDNEDESDDSDDSDGVVVGEDSDEDVDEEAGRDIDMHDIESIDSDVEHGVTIMNSGTSPAAKLPAASFTDGLEAGGFDWTGDVFDSQEQAGSPEPLDSEQQTSKTKKRRKAEIKVDRTGDLDANGPQSGADFERLLLGQPNSSFLWLSYMAFQLQLSEVDKAREIAERALRTINNQSRDSQEESLNVWVAYLNLENTYGTDERVEEVFKKACEVNDAEEVHSRLASIYIQSTKTEVCSLKLKIYPTAVLTAK